MIGDQRTHIFGSKDVARGPWRRNPSQASDDHGSPPNPSNAANGSIKSKLQCGTNTKYQGVAGTLPGIHLIGRSTSWPFRQWSQAGNYRRVVSRPYPGKRTAASVIKCRRTELVFSYKLEVPPSIGGVWPTQPKSQFCKVEIICCEGPQVFCHLRLARNLGEPHAALGELSVVFESQHCRKLILTSAVSSTQIESEGSN
jgi:hypothetical protein